MGFHIPSMAEIQQVALSRGRDSCAPELCEVRAGDWPLQERGGDLVHDVSGDRNHGAMTGIASATAWTPTEIGRALALSQAITQYIDVPISLPSDTYTFVGWVENTHGGAPRYLFDARQLGGAGAGYCYLDDAPQLVLKSSGTVYVDGELTTAWLEATWHCIAVAGITLDSTADGLLRIGNRKSFAPSQVRGIFGHISNVSVFSGTLTPSEIQDLYTRPWARHTLRARVFPVVVPGAISGSVTFTFTPTGAVAATAALGGSATATFTPTGVLAATAALGGAATATFTPVGVLGGKAALGGAATTTFTPTGAIAARVALRAAATYAVTGTLNPDATGDYVETGIYNGQPCYRRTDGAYWIWKHALPLWIISATPGILGTWWQRAFASGVAGDYTRWGGATGTATAAPVATLTFTPTGAPAALAALSGIATVAFTPAGFIARTVAGPYQVAAGDVFHTGTVAGRVNGTGAVAGDVFHAGAAVGRAIGAGIAAGAVAGDVYHTGAAAGMVAA